MSSGCEHPTCPACGRSECVGHHNACPELRWRVRYSEDRKSAYVQDTRLGYCTDWMPAKSAIADAKVKNQTGER